MMHEEVETPIGVVSVEADSTSAEVSFVPNSGKASMFIDDDTVTFRVCRRPPVPMMEVTQGGSTFEVTGVRVGRDGYEVRNGNTGAWEKWLED